MLRHDIRGALMGVMGAAGQMEAAELDADARRQVERICAASRTLACLVGIVLGEEPDPAEAEADRRVETDKLLAHLRRRYAAEAADRGLSFVVEAGAGAPAGLRTDPVALGRMLDNLVGNALKFSDAGTVRLTLARAADGSVVFRVADEGPGLAGEGAAPPAAPRRPGPRARDRPHPRRPGWAPSSRSATGRGGGVEAVLRFPPGVADERARRPPRRSGVRPRRPPGAARRGQSHQPDGRLADAARAQRRGDRLLRRRRGARALRGGAGRPRGRRHRDAAALRPRRDPRHPRPRRRPRAGADRGADRLRHARAPRADRRRRRQRADLQAGHQRRGARPRPRRARDAAQRRSRRRGGPGRGCRATPAGRSSTRRPTTRSGGDRRRDHGRAPRQGHRRPSRGAAGSRGGARRASSTARASARPRTSSSRSPAPSARCGCRAAPASSTPSPRPRPPSASRPRPGAASARSTPPSPSRATGARPAEGSAGDAGSAASGRGHRLASPWSTSRCWPRPATRSSAPSASPRRGRSSSAARPHVVLLDLQLPDGDGLELLQSLRRDAPDSRVIVITANGSINRAVQAMRAGAFDFLVKPFDEARLLSAVQNAIASAPHPPEEEEAAAARGGARLPGLHRPLGGDGRDLPHGARHRPLHRHRLHHRRERHRQGGLRPRHPRRLDPRRQALRAA